MKWISLVTALFAAIMNMHGQTPVGSWSDHLIYNSASAVCAGYEEIFASTGSSILVYNKEYDELKKMSPVNGLTETGISAINWSEEHNTLVIAYTSTNVDLVRDKRIYNIPDISRKYIPGKKEINRIRMNGKYACLACSFGIVVVDILKNEILDTWKPGTGSVNTEVWDIAFGDNRIYAATGAGVYTADLTNTGLAYFGNWTLLNNMPEPYGIYTSIVYSGNKLYVNQSVKDSGGDYVYVYDGTSSLFSFIPGVFNRSFESVKNGFIITASSSVRNYGTDGSLVSSVSSSQWPNPDFFQTVENNGELWIADSRSGLIRYSNSNNIKSYALPGPVTNNAFHITSDDGKTIISGGGADASWNNLWRLLQISIHDGNDWKGITSSTISDGMRTLIDPDDRDHFFVSTWGGGLLEYKKNVLVNQYTDANSPLQNIIPGRPYVRICGLAMDESKNLWMTQSEVQGSIKVLKPDGSWIVNPLTIDAQMIGDIIITIRGHKWIVLPRGKGLFVFDDNKTPETFGDDRSKKLLVEDTDGNLVQNIYSIAEDIEGNIWVGTDQGPLVYYNPERVMEENLKAFRIKIPRNDGTGIYDYMLKTEAITAISIDGGNRKWLGTSGSGAYLLSPDGTLQIRNYNEENSPLLSNNIASMAVDDKTGDVWFGTSKGIQSVRGDAVKGEEKFKNVYTFPNPVRQDFNGNVTIKGLMPDSRIKITDISGNLVYETESAGGEASWDLKTYNGKRVATGVYLVFCASSDGTQSCVTKMLVIK
ncbi:MAG TPA: hypothetical protein DD745_16715 [Bacteroidales bacterium]|nr:hypothetical protein [Bacteroidales bacterium]